LGTLGIITELTFKVFPAPEVARTIAVGGASFDALVSIANSILASPLAPAAVSIQDVTTEGTPAATLFVRVEGIEAAVARHERDITQWGAAAGATVRMLDPEEEAAAWRSVRDFGWDANAIAVRLTTPVAAMPVVLGRLQPMLPDNAGLVAHVGSGVTWVRLEAASPSPDIFAALKDLAVRHHGHLLYARVPRTIKAETDVWFPSAGGLGVMRALKGAFDPRGTMNPGRFAAAL
jgi:glycolate oxidase FAD binding subunit